jgi:hypothetical protein
MMGIFERKLSFLFRSERTQPMTKTVAARSKQSTRKKGDVQITGDGKYLLIPTDQIEIVERPKEGEEKSQLFFNPRSLESFTPERMAKIRLSIQIDGLQQPPVVRAFAKGKKVERVQLIAGERRLRSVSHIIEHDLPCYDEDAKRPAKFAAGDVVIAKGTGRFGEVIKQEGSEVRLFLWKGMEPTQEERTFEYKDVLPTIPGSELYRTTPCRVVYNIDDAQALRLAFAENDQHDKLSTKEEIALVERLVMRNMKVAEIADLLGSNETWVSQTANFRTALPVKAFDRLLNGLMKRHVAVTIMGYEPDDREKLFAATLQAEEEDSQRKIEEADDVAIQAGDEEILLLDEAQRASKAGDTKTAERAKRKANTAATRASKARDTKTKAESQAGQIRTSHIERGASATGVKPKKAKILPKEEIEERYITGMEQYLSGEELDPVCEEAIPGDYAAIVVLTANAILTGQRCPLTSVIRKYMVQQERWQERVAEADEEIGDGDADSYLDDEAEDDYDPSEDFNVEKEDEWN